MKTARTNKAKMGPRAVRGSDGARRIAAAILEVLSGVRGTTEVCEALSITPMRYYVLETRALQGFVAALEPRPKGKRRSPEDEMHALRREKQKLVRELLRTQALVRVAERAIGLPAARATGRDAKGGPRSRRRRSERAGRVIVALRAPSAAPEDGSAKTAPS